KIKIVAGFWEGCAGRSGQMTDLDRKREAAIDRINAGQRCKAASVKFHGIDLLVEDGMIDREDREFFWYAETAEEIWSGIQKWEREKEERTVCGIDAPEVLSHPPPGG